MIDFLCVIFSFYSYRLLFLCYWRSNPTISRMGMDGSDVTDIITTDLSLPIGLTLDFYSERIWWCDVNNLFIE